MPKHLRTKILSSQSQAPDVDNDFGHSTYSRGWEWASRICTLFSLAEPRALKEVAMLILKVIGILHVRGARLRTRDIGRTQPLSTGNPSCRIGKCIPPKERVGRLSSVRSGYLIRRQDSRRVVSRNSDSCSHSMVRQFRGMTDDPL